MAENSNIEWTDHTFNPWIGCTKVSPGCDHCYAEARMDTRLHVVHWGAGMPRKRTTPANWREPERWNRQAAAEGRRFRVFCASLADVFDNEVPVEWRADLLMLIRATPHLDWLLLTKRIGNVTRMLQEVAEMLKVRDRLDGWDWLNDWICGSPPHNVWLGASIVNQTEADRDIPKLLAVPAQVRFLSMEPLLGPVDLFHEGDPHPRQMEAGKDGGKISHLRLERRDVDKTLFIGPMYGFERQLFQMYAAGTRLVLDADFVDTAYRTED